MERYVTPREAGEILSLTPEAVRRLVRLGRLRATRIGLRIRIAEKEVERLVRTVGATGAAADETNGVDGE